MPQLERRLRRPGAEIAFTDTGAGDRTIVFVHGAGLDHTMWQDQATSLTAAGYRVVLWDMRGHGQSSIDSDTRFTVVDALRDLEAVLDECDLERVVLVGHSLGGNLAQAFAENNHERIHGIVVVDSTWNAGPLTALERFGLRIAAPVLRLIPARTLPGMMAKASATTPSAIARTEAAFKRMPKRRFLHVWTAAVSLVHPDPDYRCPVPLGLIRGACDGTGNIAAAMPEWARTEGVPEQVIPDAGHIVTWDAPEQSSRALLQIIDGWESASDRNPDRV